ncbi:hypothetical protein LXL04_027413 [Taraxacum kok-saghyz]
MLLYNILSLTIHHGLALQKILLPNVSSLLEAKLDFIKMVHWGINTLQTISSLPNHEKSYPVNLADMDFDHRKSILFSDVRIQHTDLGASSPPPFLQILHRCFVNWIISLMFNTVSGMK